MEKKIRQNLERKIKQLKQNKTKIEIKYQNIIRKPQTRKKH